MIICLNFCKEMMLKKEIGVGERAWIPFSEVVRRFMLGDWITSLSDDVSALLSHGVKTLIYSGDQDFICNWRGGESWTNKINWKKSTEFTNSPYLKWKVGQKEYGELKKVDNLTFLKVYGAGHMVPMDQPEAALEVLNYLIGLK